MGHLFKLHQLKLLTLFLVANATLLLFLSVGDLKPFSQWSWSDIIGEGGASFLALVWILLLLKSRPTGRVTSLLVAGLGFLFFSWWVDSLDEFIRLPESIVWDNWLESFSMPVGMLFLTLGIYHWHHEQLAISAQMQKRESAFRDHRLYDKVTPLGAAQYLRQHLTQALQEAQQSHKPISLVIIDIDKFSSINQRYGFDEGNKVLSAITHLLLLNLRHQDLLFRLAGDRFVVLLPDTGESQAATKALELKHAVDYFSYHSSKQGEKVPLTVTTASIMATHEHTESLLERLNLKLAYAKQPPQIQQQRG